MPDPPPTPPGEGGGGGLGGLFSKGSTAEQFLIWGVLQQVLAPLMAPLTTELQKLVYSAVPDVPLSPDAVAGMVARALIDPGTGADAANDSGIGGSDFDKLVRAAGSAPDLSAVFELRRRGLIGEGADAPEDVSVHGALADAGIRKPWHDLVAQLSTQWPSSADVLNAWLEGQIPEAQARDLLLKSGMPEWWIQPAYDANGQAPTPSQALELLNRGIIAERGKGPGSTSYEQAFLEGPWRNKWLESFIALRYYYPPPRTVTAMYHSGQLSHDEAAGYLAKQGLDATLIQAYLKPPAHASTATEKLLAKSDLITAYTDKLIDRAQTIKSLEALHYSTHDAGLLLDLADVKLSTAQLRASVGRVRTLYQAGKLTDREAADTLTKLGISHATAVGLVDEWALTQAHVVKTLTAGEITAAHHYSLIDGPSAMTLLEQLGYDTFDAWLILAARDHAPLADVPRPPSPYPAPKPSGA